MPTELALYLQLRAATLVREVSGLCRWRSGILRPAAHRDFLYSERRNFRHLCVTFSAVHVFQTAQSLGTLLWRPSKDLQQKRMLWPHDTL
jgi:hypothetical protein